MKRSLLLITLAISSMALAQDAVTMRRTFTEDLVEKFKVKGEHVIKVEADGEEFETSLSLTNNRVLTFTKVDKDGNASLLYEDVDYAGTEALAAKLQK